MFNKDRNNYLLLLLVFFAIFTIMLPFKDQLFSEDFAYAQSVRHLINTGDLKVSERVAPTSIALIIWGTAISKVFGFSLANLHLSVVMLVPFLIFGLYELFKLTGCGKEKSLIFTLFFLSIPWILQLSYTFLTDIPFLTLEVLALMFYSQGFKNHRPEKFLFGSIFTSLAFLVRQLGIFLAVAAFITILFSKISTREKIKNALKAVIIPLLTYFLYLYWLNLPGNTTIAQYRVFQEMHNIISYFLPYSNISIARRIEIFVNDIHTFLRFTSEALAIFFPIIVLFLLKNWRKIFVLFNKNKHAFIVVTAIIAVIYVFDIINFRKDYNLGFPLIIYQYENLFPIPWAHIWKYMVLIGLPTLSWTIYLKHKNVLKFNNFQRFIILSFVIMAIPTVVYIASWEQYVIPFLPLLLLWIASTTKKLKLYMKLSLIIVLILLLDSLQMTKLRYSESGLIWEKGITLVNNGVSPVEIDLSNNFGWYYWFFYEKLANDSIINSAGNKKNASDGFIIEKPINPKFRIYTERMIHYSNLYFYNYTKTQIPLKSLFVRSNIYYMKLNE